MTSKINNKKSKSKQKEMLFESINTASSLGFMIALPAVFFVFIGIFLDKVLHTSPVLTIIFILLGIVVGIFAAIKEVKKIIS